MKKIKKYTFISLVNICVLLFFTACDAKITVDKKLQGTWRLQKINCINRENAKDIDVLAEGSTEQKQELQMLTASVKPFIISFSCNSACINGTWYSVEEGHNPDYTLSGDEMTMNVTSNLVIYDLVGANLLSLSTDIQRVILTFRRGGYEGKDDDDEIPENSAFQLRELQDEPYNHPLYGENAANDYETHKDRLLVLYKDAGTIVTLGYKSDKLWLLAYTPYNEHWHIWQSIVDYDFYPNETYIFFSAGDATNLNYISEKRIFGSGNGKTPTSFSLTKVNECYVVGFKQNGIERFWRIRVKSKNINGPLIEYSYF